MDKLVVLAGSAQSRHSSSPAAWTPSWLDLSPGRELTLLNWSGWEAAWDVSPPAWRGLDTVVEVAQPGASLVPISKAELACGCFPDWLSPQ